LVNFGTSILFSPVYFNGISLSLKKIKKMADMFFLLLIVGASNLKQKKRETQDDIIIMWNIFEIRVYIIVCIIQVSMKQKYKKII
jgi:hypothetical protein